MSERERPEPQRYQRIIIVGGGCYGGYYLRQLQRAASAGALVATQIDIVDRDSSCAVSQTIAHSGSIAANLIVSDWREFFDEYLDAAAQNPELSEGDAIVPSPLMPHLMADWLVRRARLRWRQREIATRPIEKPLDVRWQRAGSDGTYYVSFADWMCPINCVEPRMCPHTRDVRDWSLPPTVSAFGDSAGARAAIMHCRHRLFGVGMFDTAEVLSGDRTIAAIADAGGEVIIGTMSHCHGALTRLAVGPLKRVEAVP